jgi:hypothetical protein
VQAAAASLPIALTAAIAAASDPSNTPADVQSLWEAVENIGATIHRQSRILAGKSRGG